jgi:hypothetical protein
VNASLSQQHYLAAIIHLCGAGAGERYARRGLRLSPGQRCGDHLVSRYLSKVDDMKRVFMSKRLATGDGRQATARE